MGIELKKASEETLREVRGGFGFRRYSGFRMRLRSLIMGWLARIFGHHSEPEPTPEPEPVPGPVDGGGNGTIPDGGGDDGGVIDDNTTLPPLNPSNPQPQVPVILL